MSPIATVLIVVGVVFLIVVARSLKIVTQFEKGLVERFGRFDRMVDPGLRIIVPFIERIRRVDMREQVVDVPPQEVITKDNVVVTVDAVVYYQATDPVKLKYNVANFILAATKLAQTNLRKIGGGSGMCVGRAGRWGTTKTTPPPPPPPTPPGGGLPPPK